MQIDKVYHLIAGLVISMSIGVIYPFIGLISSIIVGGLKEIVYDKYIPNHTVDIYDWIATCVGGIIGYTIIILIK